MYGANSHAEKGLFIALIVYSEIMLPVGTTVFLLDRKEDISRMDWSTSWVHHFIV